MLIDSHLHLDAHYFPEGADEILARAEGAGVGAFVCIGVGESLLPAQHAIALARGRRNLFATAGFHPHDAGGAGDVAFEELAALARDPAVVAIGEVGLDFHYDHSPREVQKSVFVRSIAVAREVGKPLVIHTREAAGETLALLSSEHARDVGGIIHCFSEDRAFAERALDLGFDLSFSGIVTFRSAQAVQNVARWAPIDRILVETDSPYLAPVPLRGKRCEPSFLPHTARRIAELRGITLEQLAQATSQNTVRCLRLPLTLA